LRTTSSCGRASIAPRGGVLPCLLHLLRTIADDAVLNNFDYCFPENGLTAYKLGQPLAEASFIKHVGEEEYKKLVNFILRYLSEVDVPVKR
jgi:phosphomannomutase